jgi:uncharacterized protein
MGTAEKLAIGAAAAIAAGVVASELSKDDEEKTSEESSTVVAPTHAAKPGFDCAKASSQVEKLICSDAELAALDRSLSDLYAVVLRHTPAGEHRQLKAEQRGWIKGRDDCWKDDDMRGCVASEYRTRIDELKDR